MPYFWNIRKIRKTGTQAYTINAIKTINNCFIIIQIIKYLFEMKMYCYWSNKSTTSIAYIMIKYKLKYAIINVRWNEFKYLPKNVLISQGVESIGGNSVL